MHHQATAGERREERGGAARVGVRCIPALPFSLYRHGGSSLPLPQVIGAAAKGGNLPPKVPP